MWHALKGHFSNALYGVLDYAAYPVGMVLVAPVMLNRLGTARFGVWAFATAVISAGSIIASGFGDANIQHVATQRGAGHSRTLLRTVRSAFGIHLVLGLGIALLTWVLAPLMAAHVVASETALRADCLSSLRLASLIILMRALETVCVSTQRAFERYGAAVALSVAGRIVSLLLAAGLALADCTITTILWTTLAITLLFVWFQMRSLCVLLDAGSLRPRFDRDSFRALFEFGIFTWLQALASVIIGQADRLFAGVAMGAVAVASYALCVQIAQPLYGIVSSGLHFLFPHLSARRLTSSSTALRRTIAMALLVNMVFVAIGTVLLLLFGVPVLRAVGGYAIAQTAKHVLPLVVWSTSLLSLSVTAYYTMMAFGRIRTVTLVNLAGSATMLASMFWLARTHGMYGIAMARFAYGAIALLLYAPLLVMLYPALIRRSFRFPRLTRPRHTTAAVPTHANLLGIRVEALNMHRALQRVATLLRNNRKGYVSVIGVHGIMEAQRNPRLAAIYADSALTIPDGMPTVWVGRLQGCRQMERVAGPDLMLEIFRSPQFAGYTHFLYGGEEGVVEALAANLKRWFPWVRIVGAITPPWGDLSPQEEDRLISTIRHLKPDFIWVGISAPRQEQFMHRYLSVLNTRIMFGVGAAFDFHTGRIKDCSAWIKRAGLQWLHRLLQDPRRLWRRYLRNNPAFLWHIMLQLTGLRTYGPLETVFTDDAPAVSLARPSHHISTAPAELSQGHLVRRL